MCFFIKKQAENENKQQNGHLAELIENKLSSKNHQQHANDGSAELNDEAAGELGFEKRYRLMGKRFGLEEDDDELVNEMDKRYRLMGKRYRLMGKRYRLMGKRGDELASDENDDDEEETVNKRYRLMGKRYRLMGRNNDLESVKRYRIYGK